MSFISRVYTLELEEVINWMLVRSDAMGLDYDQYCQAFEYEPDETAKATYQIDLQTGKMIKEFLGEDDFIKFYENDDY